jgi:glycosyltransferase involved in cell wall biosynthesis
MNTIKRKIRVLHVANKALPLNDYRVNYLFTSQVSDVYFAMPGRTPNIPEDHYFAMAVGEGFQTAYLSELLRLFTLLKNHSVRFDAVHFYSTLLILLGPIIAKALGIPAIITITGFGRTFSSNDLKYRLLRPIYSLLLKFSLLISKAILFQNFSDMANLSQKYPKFSQKFSYAGSAVVLKDIDIADKDFFSPQLNVLLIARLNYDKGIEDFLSVAKRLGGNRFNFTLVGPKTLGDDDLFEKVNHYSKLGIIKYLGELDISEISDLLKSFQVFYFPSYGEGMPRVMLEAGYGGLCPIAYSIPANRDLLASSRGFLIEKNDIDSVINILNNLYDDRELLREKAIAYQKHIVDNFNLDKFTKRMDRILIGQLSHLVSQT